MKRILPAYPLFVKDPYFSIWAQTEALNEKDVIFWTGAEKKIYGYVIVDGKRYCFLGDDKSCGQATQKGLSISAFTTDYEFSAGGVRLKLSFVSPLPPDDLKLLSCPVCYVRYEVSGDADTQVIFVVGQGLCYNGDKELPVRGGTVRRDGYTVSFFGLKRQMPLSDDSDRFGADWGYWYLSGEETYYAAQAQCFEVLGGTAVPASSGSDGRKVLASVNRRKSGKVMLGFDDTVSVRYFGDMLKGYYLDENTIFDGLDYTFNHTSEIDAELEKFDADLRRRAEKYGENYIDVLKASLRQSVGAHKLVKDRAGNVLFLFKECYSNGCMGTVDVSYPSMPLYLLYNPELVRGMLRPVFTFAKLPVWKYDFAPHDVGAYPNACGQVYGLKEKGGGILGDMTDIEEGQTRFPIWQLPASADIYAFENQMPVEECANVLIMAFAAFRADGDAQLLRENFDTLQRWSDYLVRRGLRPENQLCTDDFSGHLKNNLNLAVKATVGVACFAGICEALGAAEKYSVYRGTARKFAAEIVDFAGKYDHMPLTWDSGAETYSLKYNLAFDKILDLRLFPDELREREVDFYLTKINDFGVPLDNRAEFTKSDWLTWAASLTRDVRKIRKLTDCIHKYLTESEDRLPFGDWYDAKTGRLIGFRNRTVQGGCFILLLQSEATK